MNNYSSVESLHIDSLNDSLTRHFHERFSVTVIYSGECSLLVDERLYPLQGGEIILMPAYIPHACVPAQGSDVSYRVFMLPDDVMDGFAIPEEPYIIKSSGYTGPETVLTRDDDSLIQTVSGFLSDTGRGNAVTVSTSCRKLPPAVMKKIADHINTEWQRDIPLDELSEVSGLSKYYLVEKFRKSFGMTPHAYSLNTRINRARELLKSGTHLAEISLELGFYDQSHFSNTFVKYTGITPQKYRKKFL